jgi:hypothetical protein
VAYPEQYLQIGAKAIVHDLGVHVPERLVLQPVAHIARRLLQEGLHGVVGVAEDRQGKLARQVGEVRLAAHAEDIKSRALEAREVAHHPQVPVQLTDPRRPRHLDGRLQKEDLVLDDDLVDHRLELHGQRGRGLLGRGGPPAINRLIQRVERRDPRLQGLGQTESHHMVSAGIARITGLRDDFGVVAYLEHPLEEELLEPRVESRHVTVDVDEARQVQVVDDLLQALHLLHHHHVLVGAVLRQQRTVRHRAVRCDHRLGARSSPRAL